MANMKCNLTEEEWPRIFMEFDGYLTNEEEENLSAKFKQYCFYESWGRKGFRECICTSCGAFEVYKEEAPSFFYNKHKDEVYCPNCGEKVELYALGRMQSGSGLKEWQRAAFIRVAKDGGILISAGYATKDYSPNNLIPTIDWYEKSRTYLTPGKRGQWKQKSVSYWNMFCGDGKNGWERSKTVTEPFNPAMLQHDGSYWLLGLNNLYDSKLQYCQLQEWYKEITGTWLCEEDCTVRQVYKYLAAYTEYPQMEMAVKVGMNHAVEDLVMYSKKNHPHLDWKAKNIQGFLRMNKADARRFLQSEGDVLQLIHCKDAIKTNAIKSVSEYLDLLAAVGTAGVLTIVAECAGLAGVNIKKAVSYVQKQKGTSAYQIAGYWKDYLNMAQRLDLDLTEETVAMPKDLKERHDTYSTMIKLQASAEARKKYRKRYEALRKKYEFRLGDLCIVVPDSGEAIVAEGKTLHHCVGGYADRHLNGTLDILFLRHVRKPNRSFLTIELHPPKTGKGRPALWQIHGYRNEHYQNAPEAPKTKYAWFLDTWLDWVRDGSQRDKNGQPVIPAEKEHKTA